MKRISIVIPVRNRSNLLKLTLVSIQQQTVPPHEIIIVDDGSEEDIKSVIQGISQPVIYRRAEGVGPGVARNIGVEAATGELIAFLDSDDLWAPWALESVQQALTEGREGSIVYANAYNFHSNQIAPKLDRKELELEYYETLLDAPPSICVATSRLLAVSASLFRSVDGFWQHRWNSEDTDFALRIGSACPFIFMRSPIAVYYRLHSGQVSCAYKMYSNGMFEIVKRCRQRFYSSPDRLEKKLLSWVTCHARSCCWHSARHGGYREAGKMYLTTLRWNLVLHRWPFILAFPCFLAWSVLICLVKR